MMRAKGMLMVKMGAVVDAMSLLMYRVLSMVRPMRWPSQGTTPDRRGRFEMDGLPLLKVLSLKEVGDDM